MLAAAFKLSDAQELVARQAGYASWQALKQGEACPSRNSSYREPQSSARNPFSATHDPTLRRKHQAAMSLLRPETSFSVAFVYGEPPFYGEVSRDHARLSLRCVDQPVIDPALRERESLLSAAIEVDTADEIKQLFLAFQAAGVDFHQTLKHEPWGAREFIIRDPDGNLILFAGPAE